MQNHRTNKVFELQSIKSYGKSQTVRNPASLKVKNTELDYKFEIILIQENYRGCLIRQPLCKNKINQYVLFLHYMNTR